ncbi:carbohydrate porin [Pseudomonas sp. GD03860]|uniref:carbohydrate porin n=1 Tax=Pseudomonas sp. GD03860 TaxID=2975389 RepID=UPI002449E130|nr:carbohydrate porin [Pseudomonas sp. GD03860]MDH0636256.1 carbohydrate porin [Pseudomonas sp. GD03860]
MLGLALSCAGQAKAAAPFDPDALGMTGDWGGVRNELIEKGYTFTLDYVGELGYNAHGGYNQDKTARWSGQFTLGAQLDLQKVLGWQDATFKLAITEREGRNISNDRISDPRAPMYSSNQEVWGRGQTWRLTQMWISQSYFDQALNVKFGRFGEGEDFNSFPCDFQNLALCGSQMGNWAGSNIWYNRPISQWAGRVKYQLTPQVFMQVGVYEHNPSLLEDNNGFKLNMSGGEGLIMPVELVWTPTVNSLPGEYRVGAYYSSADATDVEKREAPGDLSSALVSHDSKYGYWLVAQQQVTRRNGDVNRGLSVFANVTVQDRETSQVGHFIQLGFTYKGVFDARPQDDLGFGVARISTNSRFRNNQKAINQANNLSDYNNPAYQPVQGNEYDAELYYGIHATRWLVIRPNVQYVRDPGGVSEVDDAWVLGVKLQSSF